jgi:hypothetical protein
MIYLPVAVLAIALVLIGAGALMTTRALRRRIEVLEATLRQNGMYL